MSHIYASDDFECVIRRDEDGSRWIAEYPDFPFVGSFGTSKHEALKNAETTLNHWLENARDAGVKIPKPGEIARLNGQFKIRLPKSFHRRLADLAASASLSLNELILQFLITSVSRAVTGDSQQVLLCSKSGQKIVAKSLEGVGDREYGGVWVQRAPKILHYHLESIAESEGTTLNTVVIYMLAMEYGALCADKILTGSVNSATRSAA